MWFMHFMNMYQLLSSFYAVPICRKHFNIFLIYFLYIFIFFVWTCAFSFILLNHNSCNVTLCPRRGSVHSFWKSNFSLATDQLYFTINKNTCKYTLCKLWFLCNPDKIKNINNWWTHLWNIEFVFLKDR